MSPYMRMECDQLLAELGEAGVLLHRKGDDLILRYHHTGEMDEHRRAKIRILKPYLLQIAPDDPLAALRDYWQSRPAEDH